MNLLLAAADPVTWPEPEKIAAILGAIIPVVVAIATKFNAADKVKAAVSTVLAFIAGPLAAWIAGPGNAIVSWGSAKYSVIAYALAAATYFTTWKPVFKVNERLLPDKGIGHPEQTT